MNKRFKHIHSSSRYDRGTDSLKAAVKSYIGSGASIITLTEVSAEDREASLRFPKWDSVTGDLSSRHDCAVMWDTRVWRLVHKETVEVTSTTYFSKTGKRTAPTAVASVVLRHRASGKKILFTVGHLPPGVEGPTGLTGLPRRVAAFTSALSGWRTHWNSLARTHSTSGVVVVADWNINLRKPWVRTYLKAQMPTFKQAWGSVLPKRGTHGTRIIDMSLYRGSLKIVMPPQVLAHNPSSDHTPYAETFAL